MTWPQTTCLHPALPRTERRGGQSVGAWRTPAPPRGAGRTSASVGPWATRSHVVRWLAELDVQDKMGWPSRCLAGVTALGCLQAQGASLQRRHHIEPGKAAEPALLPEPPAQAWARRLRSDCQKRRPGGLQGAEVTRPSREAAWSMWLRVCNSSIER